MRGGGDPVTCLSYEDFRHALLGILDIIVFLRDPAEVTSLGVDLTTLDEDFLFDIDVQGRRIAAHLREHGMAMMAGTSMRVLLTSNFEDEPRLETWVRLIHLPRSSWDETDKFGQS
jgi:hypothetical protein